MPEISPHARSVVRLAGAMLRTALPPGLLTVAVGAAVAGVLVGGSGVAGALVGGAVAVGASLLTLALMRWSADLPPQVVMVVAVGGYLLKMVVLLGVMVALGGVAPLHTRSLAFTFLAVVLVWVVAEVVAFRRTPIPTVVVDQER